MNLPFFMPGMLSVILLLLGVFIGITICLLKCKFKNGGFKKCLVIFFLSMTGLVLVYTLSYTIASIHGRAQINAQLAEMRKHGFPTDENDIIPSMPENTSENGAVFYNKAFALMEDDADITKLYDLEPNYDFAKWSDANRKIAQTVFNSTKMENIFNLFRQGAEKPRAMFRNYQGLETDFIQGMVNTRAIFRLISLKSSYDGFCGNPEAGYNLIGNGFKTIKQLESDPFIISQLVNIVCTTINIEAVNALIACHGIRNQTARQLISDLNKIHLKAAAARAWGGELILNKDSFEQIIAGGSKLPAWVHYNKSDWIIEKYGPCPFLYQDYACYLRLMFKIRMLYSQPYWLAEKQLKELEKEFNNTPSYYQFSKNKFSLSITELSLKTAKIESEIGAAKLTLALHIYKNEHKAFPDKLEQLAPQILKAIPVDPISGKPFEYQKTNGKFTLSSVWLKEKEEMQKKQAKRTQAAKPNSTKPK